MEKPGSHEYIYQYQPPPIVVHRSQNRVITLGSSKLRKQDFAQKTETWFSNPTDPFKQVGTF